MAFERIELNICPSGDMPVFHCSQYDVGRPIIIDLKNGDDAFTPSAGTTFELHCRKVDDNIVTLDTYEVDGNTLTFTSTEQLCACPGDNLCEVAIYLDELCMGTLNFMLHVEPDPLAGGLESETQIYNLTEQVEDITEQVICDNYYNKTEVDDLLDTKADAATTYTKTEVDTALNLKADKSTTYTKTETNNLLAGKADASDTYSKAQIDSKLSLKADKATTYTKTETDTLLGYKANASQVYTMSQTDLLLADKADKSTTYTKTQVDDALIAVMPVDTATGPIASFDTELAVPLVNVSCDVVATGGNGTPDNPVPIIGYSSANITRCGVNLFDRTKAIDGIWNTDGTYSNNNSYKTVYCRVLPNTTYTLSGSGSWDNLRLCFFNQLNPTTFTRRTTLNASTYTFTTDNDTVLISFSPTKTSFDMSTNVQLEIGNTATAYTPYSGNTYTISFGQTVYGGVLDVTRGKLHVTWGRSDMGDLSYTKYDVSEGTLFRARIDEADLPANTLNIKSSIYLTTTSNNRANYTISVGSAGRIDFINNDYSDKDVFKSAMAGIYVYYELATPFDIDLTPVQINAIIGTNNMYSDTNGDTTVQFKDSIQHYIDTKVGS